MLRDLSHENGLESSLGRDPAPAQPGRDQEADLVTPVCVSWEKTLSLGHICNSLHRIALVGWINVPMMDAEHDNDDLFYFNNLRQRKRQWQDG